ncbi:hypothetical protein [Caballeronia sp. TF1N1]|uniref:hypothetical protein n=1 Tax=Caballeronia sp. TF1N1 TaxID=2878153 RepID=UPI001FD5FF89|nr:hypothetical protein [Caballeronia sp. TF1N1]
MPNEDLRVELATISVTLGFVQRELEEARLARKGQYEKMEEQGKTLNQLDTRLGEVEKSLKTQAPTIEEFITIKHKVQGAGLFGKWTWTVLAFVIGLAFSFRTELVRIFFGVK